jgi:hypothetical protein
MSTDLSWCDEDQHVEVVLDQMRDAQIRRMPVLGKRCSWALLGRA